MDWIKKAGLYALGALASILILGSMTGIAISGVTEMLAEPTLAKTLGITAEQILATVHAHPTMSEAVMEAAEAAMGHAVHL